MNCETTTQRFSDYVDGGLSPQERTALEDHLRSCTECSGEFKVYTKSLKALHETRPLETTRVFVTNVKAAAEAHLHRKENLIPTGNTEAMTIVAPRADAPPTRSFSTPPWVPYALAALLIVSFGLGWLVSGGGSDSDLERRIQQLRKTVDEAVQRNEDLAKRLQERSPAAPPPTAPAGDKMAELGLTRVGLEWVPKRIQEGFDKGKVCIGWELLDPEDAIARLAKKQGLFVLKELPKKEPPKTKIERVVVPAKERSADEILEGKGYRNINGDYVPAEWIDRMAGGEVLVGVGQWRTPASFIEEFRRNHNLVEMNGKVMTAEQAEAIKSQQLVRMPDAATAFNDVTRFLEGLRIGPPMSYRKLTLYPLIVGKGDRSGTLRPLHASLGQGKVELVDDGALFSVSARNPLDADLIVLTGEILSGGRCLRVVAEDTVVRAESTTKIPVYCLEPEAWRAEEAFAAESGHFVAPPRVRRALIGELGQGTLWTMAAEEQAGSGSGPLERFRKRAGALLDYRSYFTVLTEREPDAIGVAAAVGNRMLFVELFQDPSILDAYIERLVAGAALEILERPAVRPSRDEPAYPNSVRGVKEFLESAFVSSYEIRDTGYGIRRGEAGVGRALITGGVTNHVLLFASGASAPEGGAAYTVPRSKMTRTLDEYENRLKDLGPSGRVAVIRDLASIRATEVTLFLLRQLKDTDTAVRRSVIQALGATGDRRATEALVPLLQAARTEPTVYAEAVGALARLGDERVVDPMIKLIDVNEPEQARVAALALPDLLLQVKNRMLLNGAMGRLVVLYESVENAAQQEGLIDPVVKGVSNVDAKALLKALRSSLNRITGLEFPTAASCRKWWNDRSARDQFLRERTGK